MEDLVKRSKIFSLLFVGWTFVSAALGVMLILSKADFEKTGTKEIFVISLSIYVIIAAILGVLEYGFIKPFGLRKEKKSYQILQDVLEDKLKKGAMISSISTKNLIKIFYSLIDMPREALKDGTKYILLVVFSALLTEWLASKTTINIPIIFFGGLVSLFLFLLFGKFFVELATSPAIKICREELMKRGKFIKEPRSKFSSLKTKFNLFFSAPILVVLVVLIFMIPLNLHIILFTFFGLAMSIVISLILYSQITETFSAIKIFTKELPKEKRALFSTGSLDVEIVELYESLNRTAKEVYTARREAEESKKVLAIKVKARTRELEELTKSLDQKVKERTKELQERVNELEKFHRLTIGRELRMAELKKEIKRLKEELEKGGNK